MVTRRRLLAGAAAGLVAPVLLHRAGAAPSPSTGGTDVLVIGAGLSGLAATLILEEFGVRVRLLEGSDRVGGRVHTATEAEVPGAPELGANGLGGGYARVLAMAKRLNLHIGPLRNRTEFGEAAGQAFHIYGELMNPEQWMAHPRNPFETEAARRGPPSYAFFPDYAAGVPFPRGDFTAWRDPAYAGYDRSVAAYLRDRGYSARAIALGAGTNQSYGSSAYDLSALMMFQMSAWTAQQRKLNKGFTGGAIAGGNALLPRAMAEAMRGDLLLGRRVTAIAQDGKGVTAVTADGARHRARLAVCTLPLSAARLVSFDPPLSPPQQTLVAEMGYTPVVQVHFVVTAPYWKKDGYPASMWTDTLAGRVVALSNDSADPARVTSLLAFANDRAAMALDRMSRKDAVATVQAELERIRPAMRGALRPVYFWSWIRTPFAGGAYAYWKPGQISTLARHVGEPSGRLHFAGEHTAEADRGMEGAMESGERVALEVLRRLS